MRANVQHMHARKRTFFHPPVHRSSSFGCHRAHQQSPVIDKITHSYTMSAKLRASTSSTHTFDLGSNGGSEEPRSRPQVRATLLPELVVRLGRMNMPVYEAAARPPGGLAPCLHGPLALGLCTSCPPCGRASLPASTSTLSFACPVHVPPLCPVLRPACAPLAPCLHLCLCLCLCFCYTLTLVFRV